MLLNRNLIFWITRLTQVISLHYLVLNQTKQYHRLQNKLNSVNEKQNQKKEKAKPVSVA